MGAVIDKVVDAVRSAAAARSMSVHRVRAQARSALVARHALRRILTLNLRRSLHEHRVGVMRSLRGPARPSAGAALRTTDAIVRAGSVWDFCAGHDSEDPTDAALAAAILTVIEHYPDGIRARDLANEVGMDWCRLIGMVSRLIEAGLVEQIGKHFYVGGQATGTW